MSLLSLSLFIAGAAALVVGFKRNHRAILSIAAVLWLASGTLSDFVDGFKDGLKQGASAMEQTRAS
jgi:phosphatidylglycerophosphate synthase